MSEFKEIIAYIFAIGTAQAIVLFFILWRKKENRFANKFLAITMLIFAVDLLAGIAFVTGYVMQIPWILGVNSTFPYLYGPLIYLYVVFLIHDRNSFSNYDYLHFIPFILVQIYGLLFFYFEGIEYQRALLDFNIPQPWHINLIGKLIPVSGITYVVVTVFITIRFNRKIKNSYANIENIDLSWLIYLVIGTAIIWIVVLISYLVGFIYGEEIQANLLIYITLSIFLYTFAIKSYKQPEIIFDTNLENNYQSYKRSGLNENRANEIVDNIVALMNSEKPFLDTKLSLGKLSGMLGISSHNLSEVINTKLNKNFYDFVNSYRVEEVKKLIKEDENSNFNILAHGYEAGFTSKSAYYSSFKKYTGMTPAQYKKQIFE